MNYRDPKNSPRAGRMVVEPERLPAIMGASLSAGARYASATFLTTGLVEFLIVGPDMPLRRADDQCPPRVKLTLRYAFTEDRKVVYGEWGHKPGEQWIMREEAYEKEPTT